jgi:hypothetical protein
VDPGRTTAYAAISNHTPNPQGWISIGDAVDLANSLLVPITGYDNKAIIVLTDRNENRPKYISEVMSIINDQAKRDYHRQYISCPKGAACFSRSTLFDFSFFLILFIIAFIHIFSDCCLWCNNINSDSALTFIVRKTCYPISIKSSVV